MYNEVFIAGSGGQGILSLGRIIVNCVAIEDKFATYYPSYGAEVRGGTANCMLKISDTEIYSPVIENPTELVVMNTPSYLKFVKKYTPTKYLFLNSSLVEKNEEIDNYLKNYPLLKVIEVPATEIANKIGNTLVSNMVMLGGILKVVSMVKIDTVKKVVEDRFNKEIISLNLKALNLGYESV